DERLMHECIHELAQSDRQRIRGRFRLMLQRIERQQRAREANLCALPPSSRQRARSRRGYHDANENRSQRLTHSRRKVADQRAERSSSRTASDRGSRFALPGTSAGTNERCASKRTIAPPRDSGSVSVSATFAPRAMRTVWARTPSIEIAISFASIAAVGGSPRRTFSACDAALGSCD